VGASADDALIDELIAVERSCCPFFTLEWEPGERRLTVTVEAPEHEPALDAIAYALGLDQAPATARRARR
jgi:hypothetical protein